MSDNVPWTHCCRAGGIAGYATNMAHRRAASRRVVRFMRGFLAKEPGESHSGAVRQRWRDWCTGEPVTKDATRSDPNGVDCDGFFRELRAIRRDVEASLGEDDIRHLRSSRSSAALRRRSASRPPGYRTRSAWRRLRSAARRAGCSCTTSGTAAMTACPGFPARYTSRVFATGRRRFVDWPDWMLPEAWKYEHNVLHHTHTGELEDPDLIERNAASLRDANAAGRGEARWARLPLGDVAILLLRAEYREAWLERGQPAGVGKPPGYTRTLWLRVRAVCASPVRRAARALLAARTARGRQCVAQLDSAPRRSRTCTRSSSSARTIPGTICTVSTHARARKPNLRYGRCSAPRTMQPAATSSTTHTSG